MLMLVMVCTEQSTRADTGSSPTLGQSFVILANDKFIAVASLRIVGKYLATYMKVGQKTNNNNKLITIIMYYYRNLISTYYIKRSNKG